jgi:serine/threonine protein kinase/WD40 repeat protein
MRMTSEFMGRMYDSFSGVGPGSRIAGYLIEDQIGAGGMAVVFRARDEVLGRLAAVKLIAPSMADDEEFRARFLRESRTVAAVDSLHIIPVYGAGEAGGLLYIATRFVPGGDLAALMRRADGPLAPGRAAELVSQVASALDAAHAAGLVHRDVKPHNILVDTVPERPEHAFLSDFGLSKGTSSATELTMSGQFVGTPDYSAPEQIRSGRVDGRADQYSLACVAFVLLTGSLPFHRDETVATMFAHLQDPVPLATRLRPELPAAVNGVLARGLAKSPADRYGRCAEFADDLRAALAKPRPVTVQMAPPPPPPVPSAPAPDPWAWLAKDGDARIPAGQRGSGPPLGFPQSPSVSPPSSPAPHPTYEPQPPSAADFEHPSLPSAFVAEWETALRENAAYANTVSGGNGSRGRTWQPPADRRPPSPASATDGKGLSLGRNRRTAVIAGAAAVVLVAAGVIYVATQHGGPAQTVSSVSKRPSKPTLTATLTVPGGGTVDTAWVSPDGKFVAASGQESTIYVWNTEDPAQVTTLTPPDMRIGANLYSTVIDNVAFSADDSSLTASVYPNVPTGAPMPSQESAYGVYRWNLATDTPKLLWSVVTPSTVAFSNDDSTVLTSAGSNVTQVTVSPELNTGRPETLPGGADQSYPPPYELDLNGGRMIYHPTKDETYVWDFVQDSVVAKLKSSEYTVLSPDGKTILVANASNYPTPTGDGSSAPPTLWDVATKSNITPNDPRWREQLREPWQTYSWDTYSTDGSVVMTKRADGKFDLWSTATHKYLLTVTDPDYRSEGYALAAAGGSEVLILANERTISGEHEYRQIRTWETPLSPPPGA